MIFPYFPNQTCHFAYIFPDFPQFFGDFGCSSGDLWPGIPGSRSQLEEFGMDASELPQAEPELDLVSRRWCSNLVQKSSEIHFSLVTVLVLAMVSEIYQPVRNPFFHRHKSLVNGRKRWFMFSTNSFMMFHVLDLETKIWGCVKTHYWKIVVVHFLCNWWWCCWMAVKFILFFSSLCLIGCFASSTDGN